jgi:hypothetical protein
VEGLLERRERWTDIRVLEEVGVQVEVGLGEGKTKIRRAGGGQEQAGG